MVLGDPREKVIQPLKGIQPSGWETTALKERILDFQT